MVDQKLNRGVKNSDASLIDADGAANPPVMAPDGPLVLSNFDASGANRDHGSASPTHHGSHFGHVENALPHGHAATAPDAPAVTAAVAAPAQDDASTSAQVMSNRLFFANQPASSGSGSAVTSDTTPPPVSPSLDDEVTYISGVTNGTVAAISSQTWTGEGPDSSKPDAVATYNQTSNASKWAPGGPTAAPSAIGSAGGTQYYYFAPNSGYSSTQITALISGLSLWSAVANIQFAQTDDPNLASLKFIATTSGGTYEQSGGGTPEAIGATLLNNQGAGTSLTVNIDKNNGGFDLGNFNDGGSGIGVILHEEGHFLGLGHGGPYNGSNDPATQQYSAYDSHEYDLMSYISANDPTEKYSASNPNPGATNYGDSTTWMPLDILAVQRLYGVATTGPLSGGQVFGYNDNVDGLARDVGIHNYFDFDYAHNIGAIQTPVVTLYDSGTGNTLDLSGDNSAETIDLRPGHYSSFAGYIDNLAIAYNTAIDNFVGGTAGATVTANADSDVFTFTGTGNTVTLLGSASDYTVTNPSLTQAVYTQTATGKTYTANNAQSFQYLNACYAPGTRIATPSGEVPIEALSIGDLVVTASGETRPIRWIGRRSYAPRFARHNKDVWPVMIRAGALAENVPVRDLIVSSLRAMYLDGLLVPATELVNGVSIVQPEPVEQVDYIHIELDTHDVVLADGAPSETFVDDESRMGFHNAHEYFELYPDAVSQPAVYCAPRVTEGFGLAAIRHRIAVRAGISIEPAKMPLRGYLDHVDSHVIEGWAQNPDHPEAPVCVDIVVDDETVAQTLANRNRGDLAQAGMGSGRHAFSVRLPVPLTPQQVRTAYVRRSSDRAQLPHSAAMSRAA